MLLATLPDPNIFRADSKLSPHYTYLKAPLCLEDAVAALKELQLVQHLASLVRENAAAGSSVALHCCHCRFGKVSGSNIVEEAMTLSCIGLLGALS